MSPGTGGTAAAGTWTVIGYDEWTGSAYGMHTTGPDPYTAMARIAGEGVADALVERLVIVGAVPGHVQLHTPGCDNDLIAAAVDLADDAGRDRPARGGGPVRR